MILAPASPDSAQPAAPRVSIIVPVYDEEGAVAALAREIADAFEDIDHEILFIDDSSRDATAARLRDLAAAIPRLRVLSHRRNAGQSRAIRTGVLAARGPIIVMLDGDGQNDPADAPRLVRILLDGPSGLGLVGGERVKRRDTLARRLASLAANAVRRQLLKDEAVDSGCGLKVFRRDAFLRLPFFDHMHRFLPALMLREGFAVAFEPVNHRPRQSGHSKYTNLGRLWASTSDIAGVIWLQSRLRDPGDVNET